MSNSTKKKWIEVRKSTEKHINRPASLFSWAYAAHFNSGKRRDPFADYLAKRDDSVYEALFLYERDYPIWKRLRARHLGKDVHEIIPLPLVLTYIWKKIKVSEDHVVYQLERI